LESIEILPTFAFGIKMMVNHSEERRLFARTPVTGIFYA